MLETQKRLMLLPRDLSQPLRLSRLILEMIYEMEVYMEWPQGQSLHPETPASWHELKQKH